MAFCPKTVPEPARQTPVLDDVDVVVAGGGPAGIAASVAAARNGARTLLVEAHGFLGGVAALGIPMQGFHDDRKRQIVKGIPWELVERLVKQGASPGPWFFEGVKRASGAAIVYDSSKLKTIASNMVQEAGARLLLHTTAVGPILGGNAVQGIFAESKAGRQAVRARVVIDASGDGDVAARAGAEFQLGNPQGFLQPVTVLFRISNVDMEAFLGDVDERPHEYGIEMADPRYWEGYQRGVRPLIGGLEQLCKEAQARGEYEMPNPLVAVACLPRSGDVLVNMALVKLIDATHSEDLTRAETTGAGYVWKTMDFLSKHVKGFRHAWVSEIAPFVAVRETRRIVGGHVLTEADMLACKKFEDRVCMGGRGVDIHDPTPDGSQPCQSMYMRFPEGYHIPYRCLVPKQVEGLLVAGRCISVSYRAFGSTRVMAQSMAVGQAAGVAAALSARTGVAPQDLDVRVVQERLRRQGAMVER